MKTSQGKLAWLAFALLLIALLLLPMRTGRGDDLIVSPRVLKMSPGKSYALKCRLSAENMDQSVEFASSNEKVAAVTGNGMVYALDSGEAVITARASGGATASMRVVVSGVALSRLELNTSEVRLGKGEYSGLRVNFNEDATDKRLQWFSADESIARVDANGRIFGVSGGETTVSVISPNGRSASAKVCVDVPATAVRITPNRLTIGDGTQVPLTASYLPLDSTDSVRRWISSDPKVLTVSADGVIHALRPGTAHVSALTGGGLSAGMEVTVENAPKEIRLNPSVAGIERGDTLEMRMLLYQVDGSVDTSTTHLVEWTSSDPSVASVDENGIVTGLKTGISRISVVCDGKRAVCRLQVSVGVREITMKETERWLLQEETARPIQLKCSIEPADADDLTLTFTSDNVQVAAVDENGLVTMTGGYGTAVITATAKSGAQATFTVNVVTELPQETPVEEASEPAQAEVSAFDAVFEPGYAADEADSFDAALAGNGEGTDSFDTAFSESADEVYDPDFEEAFAADDGEAFGADFDVGIELDAPMEKPSVGSGVG